MANNVVSLNAYQLNQHPIQLVNVSLVGFPVSSVLLGDCSGSPQRSLSTGVSVYSFVTTAAGDKYYFRETYAALLTLFNA